MRGGDGVSVGDGGDGCGEWGRRRRFLVAGRGWATRAREEDKAEEASEVFREEEADRRRAPARRRRGARSAVSWQVAAAVAMGDEDEE